MDHGGFDFMMRMVLGSPKPYERLQSEMPLLGLLGEGSLFIAGTQKRMRGIRYLRERLKVWLMIFSKIREIFARYQRVA